MVRASEMGSAAEVRWGLGSGFLVGGGSAKNSGSESSISEVSVVSTVADGIAGEVADEMTDGVANGIAGGIANEIADGIVVGKVSAIGLDSSIDVVTDDAIVVAAIGTSNRFAIALTHCSSNTTSHLISDFTSNPISDHRNNGDL